MDDFIQSLDSSWISIIQRLTVDFGGSTSFKSNMEKLYSSNWASYIGSSHSEGKLRAYSQFKKVFKSEKKTSYNFHPTSDEILQNCALVLII